MNIGNKREELRKTKRTGRKMIELLCRSGEKKEKVRKSVAESTPLKLKK